MIRAHDVERRDKLSLAQLAQDVLHLRQVICIWLGDCIDIMYIRAEPSGAFALLSHHDWAPTAVLRLDNPLPQHLAQLLVHFLLHFIRHWMMLLLYRPRVSHFYLVLDSLDTN